MLRLTGSEGFPGNGESVLSALTSPANIRPPVINPVMRGHSGLSGGLEQPIFCVISISSFMPQGFSLPVLQHKMRDPGLIEAVANCIITFGAVILLGVGISLAVIDRPGPAASVLGFAFLFLVLLLLAKFKRFKGFGFEAEMWEQKQEEAAVVLENLKEASAGISDVKDLIRSTIKSGGPPGHITPEKIQEPLLRLADAIDLVVRR
jgi:hypothetical protein